MIIWINGSFGVGKTTTSDRILAQTTGWRIFDPEWVGYMLQANLKDQDFDDFQDLPPWRSLVPRALFEVQAYTAEHLLAPQTVLSKDYWIELREGIIAVGLDVFHVVLDCDDEVLRHRIATDSQESDAEQWRLNHIERFSSARAWMSETADLVIDTTDMTPDAVARAILEPAVGYDPHR